MSSDIAYAKGKLENIAVDPDEKGETIIGLT